MPEISQAFPLSIEAYENRESPAFKTSLKAFLKARVPGGRAKSRLPSLRATNVAVDSFEQPAEAGPVARVNHLPIPDNNAECLVVRSSDRHERPPCADDTGVFRCGAHTRCN
jgi:hypothetical protein